MTGTKAGAVAWRKSMEKTYGPNWREEMKKRASKGGRNGHTGGFTDRELARRAGAIGGRKSRRRKVVKDV